MTEFFLEPCETKLSFAVRLIDDFTGKNPIGNVTVSLKDRKEKPVRNFSQHYVFLDIFDINVLKDYVISVMSDYYIEENLTFSVDSNGKIVFTEDETHKKDSKYPLITIYLKPNYSYPFSYGDTLIRGTICDSGDIVPGVPIKVLVKENGNILDDINTETSNNGEFMFYFTPSKLKEFITNINSKKTIKFEVLRGSQVIAQEWNLIGKMLVIRCDRTYYTIP